MTNQATGTDIYSGDNSADGKSLIDFVKMFLFGLLFVFVRFSQDNWVDAKGRINWPRAKVAGLLRGAYHVIGYSISGDVQADLLMHQFPDGYDGECELVADYEVNPPAHGIWENIKKVGKVWRILPWSQKDIDLVRNTLKAFLERLKALGIKAENIAIYTSPGFWKTFGSADPYWAQYKLWLAAYTGGALPIVPAPWTAWDYWQDTGKWLVGLAMGLFSKEADRDYANCDVPTFYARHGGSPVIVAPDPTPTPTPAPDPQQFTDLIVKIRTHHSNLIMEPATVPVAFTAKEAKQVVGLDPAWQDYILAINGRNTDIFARIADPVWGPTTGFSNGKLFLIGLAYWLQKVRKLETVIGADGKPWARIACLGVNDPPPDPAQVNYLKTPWLVHHVTMQSKSNRLVGTGMPNTDNAYVPLVANQANQMFLPMSLLSLVAVISAYPAVNVRSGPNTDQAIIDRIAQGNGALVTQVQLGQGGVWAQGSSGWFALRYNGALLSDWIV